MTRFWTTLFALTVACLIGLSASAQEKKDGPKKPPKPPEEVFKALDKDNDGKVTLDEFKANRKKPEQIERAEKVFKAKDTNNDGSLTLDEFKAPPPKKEGKGGKKK
ncbi:MAG: EF-hand domain-containing protein [Thermoguttaceae bacterium]